jgi:hypothetical protein
MKIPIHFLVVSFRELNVRKVRFCLSQRIPLKKWLE